jgi:ABC-type amino acid transport substrate-binding protein
MRRLIVLVAVGAVVAVSCGGGAKKDGANAPPKAVKCTGSGLKTIREGTLTVGSDIAYAPFESVDPKTQKPVGFDIDLMTELAKRNELNVAFVNQSFSGIIAGLLARQYDAIASSMTITPERRAQLCFSEPYFDADQSVVVRKVSADTIKSSSDLTGKTVGVQAGTTGEQWANDHLKGKASAIKSYETADDAFLDLKSGKIDAIVNDIPVNLYRQRTDPELRVVERIATDEHYGIAVHPSSGGLLARLNKALAAVRKDGTYDKIYESWFGTKPGSSPA